MQKVFLKKIKFNWMLLSISFIEIVLIFLVLIEYGFNFKIIVMIIFMIFMLLVSIYLDIYTFKFSDIYKLKEVNEYSISNKQYFELRESIFNKKNNLSEIAINKATNTFECLDIALDISNWLGINDYSSGDSSEKVIRVEVYKAYRDMCFLFLEYPEKITILKEIR